MHSLLSSGYWGYPLWGMGDSGFKHTRLAVWHALEATDIQMRKTVPNTYSVDKGSGVTSLSGKTLRGKSILVLDDH